MKSDVKEITKAYRENKRAKLSFLIFFRDNSFKIFYLNSSFILVVLEVGVGTPLDPYTEENL